MVSLDDLSTEEQRKLYADLVVKFGAGKGKPVGRKVAASEMTDDEDIVWSAMQAALSSREPFGTFVERYGSAKFAEAIVFLRAFLDDACGPMIRKPLRIQILRLCFEALAKHMAARDVPVSASVLLGNLGKMRHAVDARYPGYVRARLLAKLAIIANG